MSTNKTWGWKDGNFVSPMDIGKYDLNEIYNVIRRW